MTTNTKLLHYNPNILIGKYQDYPGMKKFSHIFKIFGSQFVLADRTKTIKFPIKTETYFPIPKFRVMNKTYAQICDERARELIKKAEERNINIYVFYSGGIDSTLVLASLLKVSNEDQTKRITVLMSEDSVKENPKFFEKHIKYKLKVESLVNFPDLLGLDDLFVSGKDAEFIFAVNLSLDFAKFYCIEKLNENYSRQTFIDFLNSRADDKDLNLFWTEKFEKLVEKSPVKIRSFMHFIWWVGFCFKWDPDNYVLAMYVKEKNKSKINLRYINQNFLAFFNTEDFQLWAMNNMDIKIKDTFKSFKQVSKDVIYSFDFDADYCRNKIKVASYHVANSGDRYNFLDADFNFYYDLPSEDFFEPNNDFV